MRPLFRRGLYSALALAGFAAVGSAQTAQQLGSITAADVVVRSSPKADAPDAGQLFRGTDVIVHHAEGDDWLAIQPPPGAISWINHKFVEVAKEKGFPQNAVVHTDGEVRIAAGKAGVNKPLDVRKTSIPDGSIVRVLAAGVKADDDGSVWYPIQPLKDDFRYVPKAAVQIGGPTAENFVVRSPLPAPKSSISPAGLTASIAGPASFANKPAGWPGTHPTWVDAEAAETAKDHDKAIRLYFQLARESNAAGGDADLANLCYARIHAIREKTREAGGAKDSNWTAPKGDSPRADRDDGTWTKRGESSTKAAWTGAGTLRAAKLSSGGKSYYALEDSRGQLLAYAVAGATGLDLERYSKRKVDLYGTTAYSPELRANVVTVTRVDAVK
jgi:hypothetical protein